MCDEKWMHIALEEAKLAVSEQEVPVGAIVVHEQRLISRAHNLCRQKNDPTLHAECLALKQAWDLLGCLDDCTLYVTLEPCAMCTGTLLSYRLPRLVFGAFDAKCGCCGSTVDWTDHWFLHSVETVGGILETECSALLQGFFRELRDGSSPQEDR